MTYTLQLFLSIFLYFFAKCLLTWLKLGDYLLKNHRDILECSFFALAESLYNQIVLVASKPFFVFLFVALFPIKYHGGNQLQFHAKIEHWSQWFQVKFQAIVHTWLISFFRSF